MIAPPAARLLLRARVVALCVLVAAPLIPGCASARKHAAVTPNARKDDWWHKRLRELNARVKARAKRGGADLLFIGDSITEGWERSGRAIWNKHYAHRKALNLGINGDRTQELLWRLRRGHLEDLSPKAVVLLIGVNNAFGHWHTSTEIADGIVAVVRLLRRKLPRAKVLLLSIFPAGPAPGPLRDKTARASRLAAKRIADGKRVHHLDIGARFTAADGRISTRIMPDYLHLSEAGYRIWAAAIEGKLRQLLGERRRR